MIWTTPFLVASCRILRPGLWCNATAIRHLRFNVDSAHLLSDCIVHPADHQVTRGRI